MTSQLLTNELTALFQDSKRKNQDLRNAAEKSLGELKALPQTSEAQLSADLKNRPIFLRPFLLACATRNSKFAGSAVICLQRLVLTKALAKESLNSVLEAFRECTSLALDIQLKVLQALPSLLQNYSDALSDKLLAAAFEVCFSLYSSKTAVVSNTAAAALQQLVASTFEKIALEDGSLDDEVSTAEVTTPEGVLKIRQNAFDAYRLLNDICLMTEGQRPQFLAAGSLSQNFGFELIESILSNYADTLMAHPEQIHVLRLLLMPLIIKITADKAPFATTIRVMRLLQLIISRLLFALAPECEKALSLLNRIIEADISQPWKRAVAMEVFRDLHADPTLMRSVYEHYDEDDQRKDIIRDHLASLVRLASERPNTIGLGQQSTMSVRQKDDWSDQAALQASGIVGTIGAAINIPESETSGISTQWSMPRTPYLELLDKTEPPNLPATYLYALAVTCISNFSDGLGKFLLPFTSPKENKSKKKDRSTEETDNSDMNPSEAPKPPSGRRSFKAKKVPVNPLSLEDHVLYRQIQTSAHMVDKCWPALLATSSTFLNATMDSEFFHALIRSFQKFTQVAGLLGLATPRDAFLTTLAKHSLPIGRNMALMMRPSLDQSELNENSDAESSPTPSKRSSIDLGSIAMTSRNLLCLRALLNLGIALGPLLQSSWSIVLETLQQAEFMLPKSSKRRLRSARQSSQTASSQVISEESKNGEDFGLEILAAETAASRMIESSGDLPDEAFLDFVKCLSSLMRSVSTENVATDEPHDGLLSPQTPVKKHQRAHSLSTTTNEGFGLQGDIFVLEKLDYVLRCNTNRLINTESGACLEFLIKHLETSLSDHTSNSVVRVQAAETMNDLVVMVATSKESTLEEQDILRQQMFSAILTSISALYTKVRLRSKDTQNCDVEIHRILLEALRSILEHCGDWLQGGWDTVFAIITSTFDRSSSGEEELPLSRFRTKSPQLVRSSYGSLQLICSDFLNHVPLACLSMLLDTLYMFSSQAQDLNISLTTATFFANVSGFLQHRSDQLAFDHTLSKCTSDDELALVVERNSSETPLSALWLLLMSRLKDITVDERLEVRHSALHTLFRLFSECGDDLSGHAWRACFNIIIRQTLDENQRKYNKLNLKGGAEAKQPTSRGDWNQTAIIIVHGTAGILASNLSTMKEEQTFSETWRQFLQYLRNFLERGVQELSNAVFAGLVSILEEIEDPQMMSQSMVDEAWTVWKESNPASHSSNSSGPPNNQDALLSYLRSLSQILRLRDTESRTRIADEVIEELQTCIVNANVGAYSTDIDRATPVQQGVLENLKMIPATSPAALSHIASFVTFLVRLPYIQNKGKQQGQTHLAVSKTAIGLLQKLVINHSGTTSNPHDLITQALDALAEPIQLKYTWYADGKAPSLWRSATSAVLEILQTCMPSLLKIRASDEDTRALWEQVVRVIDGVITANCETCKNKTTIPEDQSFDISAFHALQKLTIPTLGSPTIPSSLRITYAKIIFEKSQIHEPDIDDLARPDQHLLEGLKTKRLGRTYNVPPTPRIDMSYVLLDELFSLVAAHDGSADRVRLAQAAAPYLILRAGLTLKAYVLDHPLRGRAPQPSQQKREMIYVLGKLVELDCEPDALPDAEGVGVVSRHKKLLYRLYPLVMRAVKVTVRDEELKGALEEVLVAVGEDFGV